MEKTRGRKSRATVPLSNAKISRNCCTNMNERNSNTWPICPCTSYPLAKCSYNVLQLKMRLETFCGDILLVCICMYVHVRTYVHNNETTRGVNHFNLMWQWIFRRRSMLNIQSIKAAIVNMLIIEKGRLKKRSTSTRKSGNLKKNKFHFSNFLVFLLTNLSFLYAKNGFFLKNNYVHTLYICIWLY